ncbi:MAG: CidA/LrgA family protein, partial [Lactobacillus sp.]|nr:CidA/LrgA family protein [Lactobacillus sp.]
MKKEKTKSAPILVQMFIYAAILFVAQIISDLMPKSFPVPTPVIGLVLLYVLLTFHVIKVEWVDSFGSALI